MNALNARGGDYRVFRATAEYFLQIEPIYDLTRDGGDCFKYPPWIALGLAPLALFPADAAQIIWRLALIAAIFYVFNWTRRESGSLWLALAGLVPFWGFWVINIVTGQITLLLLAMALLGYEWVRREGAVQRSMGWALLLSSLSAKLFHAFALLAIPARLIRWRPIFAAAGLLLVLGIPSLLAYDGLIPIVQAYVETATSSGHNLGGGLYGLPALWARAFGLDPLNSGPRLIGFIPSLLLAVGLIIAANRRIDSDSERFAISLALSAAIHPLAFSVAFVWAYPLAVISFRKVWFYPGARSAARVLLCFSLLLIIVADSKLTSALPWLGLFAPKAVGVFLMATAALMTTSPQLSSSKPLLRQSAL